MLSVARTLDGRIRAGAVFGTIVVDTGLKTKQKDNYTDNSFEYCKGEAVYEWNLGVRPSVTLRFTENNYLFAGLPR